jgi:glycine C-acetyltransferase
MVERLWKNTDYFRSKIEKLGFDIGVGQSPIIPIGSYQSQRSEKGREIITLLV